LHPKIAGEISVTALFQSHSFVKSSFLRIYSSGGPHMHWLQFSRISGRHRICSIDCPALFFACCGLHCLMSARDLRQFQQSLVSSLWIECSSSPAEQHYCIAFSISLCLFDALDLVINIAMDLACPIHYANLPLRSPFANLLFWY
jgi:hypothetical protein